MSIFRDKTETKEKIFPSIFIERQQSIILLNTNFKQCDLLREHLVTILNQNIVSKSVPVFPVFFRI